MAPKKEVNTGEAPSGIVADDSYKTGRNEPVPVASDDARVEDPIDDKTADTDAQLGKHTTFTPLSTNHVLMSIERARRQGGHRQEQHPRRAHPSREAGRYLPRAWRHRGIARGHWPQCDVCH
jgi:hypothetical protein